MSLRPSVRRRGLLQLETLEQRENPAGTLTTAVTGGVLTITGTDDAESFIIKQLPGGLLSITGENNTVVGGTANGNTTTAGAITSVKMMLKGGDDSVSLDTGFAFNLPGALTIDGGDGANTVTLTTTASPITLGGFSYTGGEGADSISIGQLGAGAATAINGAFNVSAGNGATSIGLTNATVAGDVTAKSGIGIDTLQLTTVTASKNLNFDAGFGDSTLSLLGTTVVTGGGSYKALDGDDTLNLDNATINGKTGLTVAGGRGDVTFNANDEVVVSAGGVTLTGTEGTTNIVANTGSFTTFGDLKASNLFVNLTNNTTSTTVGGVTHDGLTVANLALTAGDGLTVDGSGDFNISKNLTLAATSPVGTISSADFESLQLGGNLASTSVGDQSVILEKGLVGGSVSLVSKKSGAQLSKGGLDDLTFNKGITVNGLISASVQFLASPPPATVPPTPVTALIKVGGDITATSSVGNAGLSTANANLQLAGGIKLAGARLAVLNINAVGGTGATVAKDVSVTSAGGGAQAVINSDAATLSGKLTVSGATNATLNAVSIGAVTPLTIAKDVSVTAVYGDAFAGMVATGAFSLGGKFTVTGGHNTNVQLTNSSATASTIAGDSAFSATRGSANLMVNGGPKTFNGNVSLKGYSVSVNQNTTGAATTYAKNLTVTGGAGNDLVQMGNLFTVTGDSNFNLGDGQNNVILSSTSNATDFGGKLTVKTGNGNDTTTFVNVQAAGDVSVTSLAGNDVVYVDGGTDMTTGGGSTFAKTFTADTGAGDDIIDLGSGVGVPGGPAATFTGKVTIKTGAGNDKLILGTKTGVPSNGDANSIPVFLAAGSTIDGGLGFNTLGADNLTLPLTNLTVTNFV
ncbi:beta strand repeat-containing protein [Zavarzinella formosa]|uniref:beta strand repeat-containing protein n=1 Tax=Zavarzinella formosa TaxID=360055 RepID=UPI0002FAEC54|nr:hypothetical protein [Zavarzinella formosa]